jgi:hypothetical protein
MTSNTIDKINEITTFDEKEFLLNKSKVDFSVDDDAYDKRWHNTYEYRNSDKEFVLTDNGYELKNNSKTWYYTKDISKGFLRGGIKLTEGIGSLALATLEKMNIVSEGSVENFANFYQENIYEKIGDTETMAGGFAEGIGQFIIPGIGAYGMFAKIFRAKGVWPFLQRALSAEAVTVGVAQVPGDPNFAAFISQMLGVDSTKADNIAKEFWNYIVTPDVEYGESYNADDVFSSKLKAIIGDAPLGPVGEGLVPLFKMFAKGVRKLRGNKEVIEEIDKNIVNVDEKVVLPGIKEKDIDFVSAKGNVEQMSLVKSNFIKFIKDNPEGFTISIDGTLTPNKGFVVAPLKNTEHKINADTISMDDIDIFAQNIFALRQATDEKINVYAGGWLNKETNEYVLDAVHILDNEADALYVAKSGNQDAIFDLGNFNEIRTEIGIKKLEESGAYSSNKADEFRANKDKLTKGFEQTGSKSNSITKTEDLTPPNKIVEEVSPDDEIYNLKNTKPNKEFNAIINGKKPHQSLTVFKPNTPNKIKTEYYKLTKDPDGKMTIDENIRASEIYDKYVDVNKSDTKLKQFIKYVGNNYMEHDFEKIMKKAGIDKDAYE